MNMSDIWLIEILNEETQTWATGDRIYHTREAAEHAFAMYRITPPSSRTLAQVRIASYTRLSGSRAV